MSLNSDNSRVSMKNAHLRRAQINKNDEFYTSAYDVRKFIDSCADYFEGKIVYCNCDDPEESEIAKYFIRNYTKLKLKGLFCTCYRQNPEIKAYKYYYNGVKMRRKEIAGNGSFDNAEFEDIYNKIDIVVTNPPFSLANKFVQFLLSKNIKFLIICNINIGSASPAMQCLESGELHFCTGLHNHPECFVLPFHNTAKRTPNGRKFCRLSTCVWMTNTEIDKRKRFVSLTKFDKQKHKTFDNWQHCININRLSQLPCDYEGLIAVPITFLYKPVAGYRFLCFVADQHSFAENRVKPRLLQDGKITYTRCLILKAAKEGKPKQWRKIRS